MEQPNCFAPFEPACYHNSTAPRIVSLWDMLQIDTRPLHAALTHISACIGEYKILVQLPQGYGRYQITPSLDQKAQLLTAVRNLASACEQHGFKTTRTLASEAFDKCGDILASQAPMSQHRMMQLLPILQGLATTFIVEAQSRKFYALSGDVDEKHDDADTLFGADVIDAFPHAAFDISEAGKCVSFGLWTACVMHTMRVLEIGLQALAENVAIEPSDNWNKTLNDIEAALRAVRRNTSGPEAEQWAAEAGTHLRFIKNAWRNQAMHHVSKYNEQEAKAIFGNARAFMKHMASKINQSPE